MTNRIIRPRRSFIFTLGLRRDMFPKALASRTDIVRVELEDGIAPKDKAEARQKAFEAWFSTIIKTMFGGVALLVSRLKNASEIFRLRYIFYAF